MRKFIPGLAAFLMFAASAVAAPQTMRLDYFHTGDVTHETFSFDRVVIEPLPWPGDMTKTIDPTDYGKYFFEVRDTKTNRVLYSRGFASVYGEWETTDEAARVMRTLPTAASDLTPEAPTKQTPCTHSSCPAH